MIGYICVNTSLDSAIGSDLGVQKGSPRYTVRYTKVTRRNPQTTPNLIIAMGVGHLDKLVPKELKFKVSYEI